MTTPSANVDVENKSVTYEGTTYSIQEVGPDTYAVLDKGVPVGRIVYSFGAANGVPEGDALSEDALYAIGEAWFAAVSPE
jgi:hypothetical protein